MKLCDCLLTSLELMVTILTIMLQVETIYILERHELESQRLRLLGDKVSSQADMRKKLGQLLYLENLRKYGQ